MKRLPLFKSLLVGSLLLTSVRAFAFAEDLKAVGTTTLQECYTVGGVCIDGVGRRSTIHVDATYAVAIALGFREDVAYWIAAYSEAADEASYVPFGACGQPLADKSKKTMTLDGVNRSNAANGGLAIHFMVPFSPAGGLAGLPPSLTGLNPFIGYQSPGTPFVVDNVYEGTLSQLRAAALMQTSLVCAYGFTSPVVSTSYFAGTGCWAPQASIGGSIPLSQNGTSGTWKAQTANQLLAVGAGVSYTNLQASLDLAAGELWLGLDGSGTNKKKIPQELVRMGVYLHALQDRISHAYCGDFSYASYAANAFKYNYSSSACTNGAHDLGHVSEVAVSELPLRDFTALDYAYDELGWFKLAMAPVHPTWFKSSWVAPSKDELVGTLTSGDGTLDDGEQSYVPSGSPRSITMPLTRAATDRVNGIASAIDAIVGASGSSRMPGYNVGDACP